jgi:hypothetical protein
VLNDAELRQLTGRPGLLGAAREVLSWGPPGPSAIIAKQGEYGAAMITADSYFSLPAFPLETVVDPTGAGDTFAGGFIGYVAAAGAGRSTTLLRRAELLRAEAMATARRSPPSTWRSSAPSASWSRADPAAATRSQRQCSRARCESLSGRRGRALTTRRLGKRASRIIELHAYDSRNGNEMSTKPEASDVTAPTSSRESSETLTITDNRTGSTYEVPITDGAIRSLDLRQIKVDEDDFGLLAYDPAFMNTASCRSAITFLDGDSGSRVPRLPDRAARRALDLPRGRLPAGARRAADQGAARRLDPPDHDPHLRARERQELHPGLPPRRAPDGDAARSGRCAVDLLSRREQDPRRREPRRSRRSA